MAKRLMMIVITIVAMAGMLTSSCTIPVGPETLSLEDCQAEVQDIHEFEEYLFPGYAEIVAQVPIICTPLELPAGTIIEIEDDMVGNVRELEFTYGDTGVRVTLDVGPEQEADLSLHGYYGDLTLEMVLGPRLADETQSLYVAVDYPEYPEWGWEEVVTIVSVIDPESGREDLNLRATVEVAGQEMTVLCPFPESAPPWPECQRSLAEFFDSVLGGSAYPPDSQEDVVLAAANELVWGALSAYEGVGEAGREQLKVTEAPLPRDRERKMCAVAMALADIFGPAGTVLVHAVTEWILTK